MTLVGQTAAYWQGDRATVTEANPAARWLMMIHPMAFVIAAIISCLVVAVAILTTNRSLAVSVSMLVTIGHTIAACGWLAKTGPAGWVSAVALLLLAAFAMRRNNGPTADITQ